MNEETQGMAMIHVSEAEDSLELTQNTDPTDIIKIELHKPITVKVKTVDEEGELKVSEPAEVSTITLDFSKINGYSLLKAENKARRHAPTMTMPVVTTAYLVEVAAMAAGIAREDIMKMSAADYTAITWNVQNFLLSTGVKA